MPEPVAGTGAASSSDATTSQSGTTHFDGVALRVQVEELQRDNARLSELVSTVVDFRIGLDLRFPPPPPPPKSRFVSPVVILQINPSIT